MQKSRKRGRTNSIFQPEITAVSGTVCPCDRLALQASGEFSVKQRQEGNKAVAGRAAGVSGGPRAGGAEAQPRPGWQKAAPRPFGPHRLTQTQRGQTALHLPSFPPSKNKPDASRKKHLNYSRSRKQSQSQ